jgi:hypothetical protein
MPLTAKSLSDIVQSLRNPAAKGSDKRKQARVGMRSRAEIQVRDQQTGFGGERLAVWVRDVSAGGIGLLSSKALSLGALFGLLLDGDGGLPEEVLCVIVYERSVGGGLYRIGARFKDYQPRSAR